MIATAITRTRARLSGSARARRMAWDRRFACWWIASTRWRRRSNSRFSRNPRVILARGDSKGPWETVRCGWEGVNRLARAHVIPDNLPPALRVLILLALSASAGECVQPRAVSNHSEGNHRRALMKTVSLEQELNPVEAQVARFDLAAQKLNLDEGLWKVLRYPTR